MTQITPVEELLEETRALISAGKELAVRLAYKLYILRENGEWERYGHTTFPKFCQEELELPQSTTSKYLTIAEYYQATYQPEDIGSVDAEKLYLSAKLEGTPEENLAKAKTWSRDDFKQNKAEIQPHEFERVCYCKVCGMSEERHT